MIEIRPGQRINATGAVGGSRYLMIPPRQTLQWRFFSSECEQHSPPPPPPPPRTDMSVLTENSISLNQSINQSINSNPRSQSFLSKSLNQQLNTLQSRRENIAPPTIDNNHISFQSTINTDW